MNDFHYAMVLAHSLYGVDEQPEDFEELGLIAYNKIGNKRMKLKVQFLEADKDGIVNIPCDSSQIEAVTYPFEDALYNSPIWDYGDIDSIVTEHYIESRKFLTDPLYISGRYVKYVQIDPHKIQLKEHIPEQIVRVLYKEELLDKDGLPQISDNEALAIATYVAQVNFFKRGLATNNNGLLQASKELERKYAVYVDQARIPDYLSQNELNEILDVKVSHDRKIFNKSFKPLK